jgi:tRNA threonylcarbamoyladenosine biosynthesis protein TsaE
MAPEEARVLVSPSPASTEALGEELGRALGPGALLALVGELGSGKTTLVRGLARGLGVEEGVHSPTFTRMRELPGRVPLYHFDAWRAGSEALFEEAAEFLAGTGVAVIEWADRVEAWLPRPRLEIRLAHRGPEERTLELVLIVAGPEASPAQRERERELQAALERARGAAGLARERGQ